MNKKVVIFLIIIIIVAVIGGILFLCNNYGMNVNNYKEKNDNIIQDNETSRKIIENVKYMEVTIEDEEAVGAEYKDFVKIENTEIIEELVNMINQGKKHNFNEAFSFDIPPYANFYLENGDKITIVAIDDFGMEGEESGNYIIVTINNDEANKKIYKVQDKIADGFTKLYNENEKQTSNLSYIVLYDGLEIKKKIGIQYLDYMKNTNENKEKYEITYSNYEKGKFLGQTKGIFGEEDVYDGYSYVENVKKIAISEKFDAMPRNAVEIKELPEELQELSDYSSVEIEKIDLDDNGSLEYIVCVNQYTSSEDYDNVNENETYSEIILFDSEFHKKATLASWENKGVQELSKEMCLQLENVIYLDIDNDNNMEILIELPAYDASILSILKYSDGDIQGNVDYKVNLEP